MHEAEWQTRKQRIDTKLRALSPAWEIIPWQDGLDLSKLTRHVVTEIPTTNGPADYGFFVNGSFLGILEAKKVTVNPQNVLEQAKRYARGVVNGPGNWNGYHVPFLYASNGELSVSSKKVDRFDKYETVEGYLDAFSRFVKENADKVLYQGK